MVLAIKSVLSAGETRQWRCLVLGCVLTTLKGGHSESRQAKRLECMRSMPGQWGN